MEGSQHTGVEEGMPETVFAAFTAPQVASSNSLAIAAASQQMQQL
jgi:hypothetical protein